MDKLIEHIKKLIASGWSQSSIAREVGSTQPTVFRILNGVKCSYDVGKKIELLKEKVTT